MKQSSEEQLDGRREATDRILDVIDMHRLRHKDASAAALNDFARAVADCGEQTCVDLMSEIKRRML